MTKKKDEDHKGAVYSFTPSRLVISLNFIIAAAFFLIPFIIFLVGEGDVLKPVLISLVISILFGHHFWKHAFHLLFTKCYLYKAHIEVETGWIHIYRRVVGYDKIVDLAYDQPIPQRLLGVGHIIVTTSSIHHERIELKDIDKPDLRYNKIRNMIADFMKRSRTKK